MPLGLVLNPQAEGTSKTVDCPACSKYPCIVPWEDWFSRSKCPEAAPTMSPWLLIPDAQLSDAHPGSAGMGSGRAIQTRAAVYRQLCSVPTLSVHHPTAFSESLIPVGSPSAM